MFSLKCDLRAVLYTPGGDRQGVIRAESIDFTDAFNDIPAVTVTLSEAVYSGLPDFMEIAAEYFESDWVEPANARFVVQKTGTDDKDPAKIRTLNGLGLVPWYLAYARLGRGTDTLVDGDRPFNSANPGAILRTVFDEAKARGVAGGLGWAPGVTCDFTASTDSGSVAWPEQISMSFKPGTPAWLIMSNLIDQGLVDFTTQGRVLHAWIPDHGTDRSTGGAPVRLGTREAALPINRDLSQLITDAVIQGEGDLLLSLNNPSAPTGFGRLETYIEQGGVSDEGTATLLAQAQLKAGSQVREEITAKGSAQDAIYLPWVDYQTGDWVSAWVKGDYQKARVQQLTVSKNADGVTLGVTLNDRFLDAQARIAKRTLGIVGGAVAGGSGAVPSTEDNRKPKPPTNLLVSSTGYWSEGTPLSQLAAQWAAVDEGENSVSIGVDLYEVWAREDGFAIPGLLTSSETVSAAWSPFTPGSTWWVKVRARSGNGVWGGFSAESQVVMLSPVFRLGAPTAPNLASSNAVVRLSWDGFLDTDPPTGPSADLMQVNVEASDSELADYSLVGTVRVGQEQLTVTGLNVGQTAWFRLVAVDKLGRPSDPGVAASVTVDGIDGGDVMVDTLSGNTIIAGTIEAQALAASVGGTLDISANDSISIVVGQVQEVADAVDGVGAGLDATNQTLVDMRTYYQFGPDGAVISKPGSPLQFVMTNTGAKILESGTEVSSWSDKQFHSRAVVADVLTAGNLQFVKHGAGTVVKVLN